MDKFYSNALIALGAIFLFVILIFGSFSLMINYKDFYISQQASNHVYENLEAEYSINYTEAVSLSDNVINNWFDYMKGKAELKYFTPQEQEHMHDVKQVISAMNFIYYTSAIFFIAIFAILYYAYKKEIIEFIHKLSRILFYGSIAAGIFLILWFLAMVFNFEAFFIIFHLILFPQGNWQFPADSLLITIFPEQFFVNIGLRIFIYAFIQAIIFFFIGYWLKKQVKLHKKYHGK